MAPFPALLLLPPGLALGWEPAAFRAYVGVLQGLQPCCGAGLQGERALSFGLLCLLQQSSHRELGWCGKMSCSRETVVLSWCGTDGSFCRH